MTLGMDIIKALTEKVYRQVPIIDYYAAVNIILIPSNGVSTILIERTERKEDFWKGDIAFPGGRKIDNETDPAETALRETWEEIGVPKEKLEVLGYLKPILSHLKFNVTVVPVVSLLKEKVKFRLNPREVSNIFIIPLDSLQHNFAFIDRVLIYTEAYTIPYTKKPIWGITKRILDILLVLYKNTKEEKEITN